MRQATILNKLNAGRDSQNKDSKSVEYHRTKNCILGSLELAGIFRLRRKAENFAMMNSVITELTKQGLVSPVTITSEFVDYISRSNSGTIKKVHQ